MKKSIGKVWPTFPGYRWKCRTCPDGGVARTRDQATRDLQTHYRKTHEGTK